MSDQPVTERPRGRDIELKLAVGVLITLSLIAAAVILVLGLTGTRTEAPSPTTIGSALDLAAVFDDFDRPDATDLGLPRKGPAWSFLGPEWKIDAHQARALTSSGTATIALTVAESADGLVRVTMPKVSENAGLIFRFHDLNNYWQLVAAPQFGTFSLSKIVDGQYHAVGDAGLVGTRDGSTIGVTLHGAEVSIVVDDRTLATFTDPDLQSERTVGLVTYSPDTRFDDFLVSVR
jgi:hypothetical protein